MSRDRAYNALLVTTAIVLFGSLLIAWWAR